MASAALPAGDASVADVAVLAAVVVVAIVAHELAHLVAARLVGHDVFEIQIGGGPIWHRRIGAIDLRLAPLPLGGHVQTGARSGDGFRWRTAVVAGAGVAANLVLLGIGAAAHIELLVGFNAIAVVANLWPGSRRRLGQPSSDGRLLLDLARGDTDAIAEERSGWFSVRALRAHDAGDLDRARRILDDGLASVGETRALLAVAGLIAFEQRRFVDVVDAYAPLIGDDRVTLMGRAGFAADAAWAASLSGDPDRMRLAEPWAAFARRARPRVARRRLVHALALVDADRPAEALDTLGGLDDASAAAVRVLALLAVGDTDGARRLYEDAVRGRFEPAHPLERRVARALSVA